MILNFLLVGLGGAIGSMLRHGVGVLSLKFWGENLPMGTPFITMSINIIGSFLIGIIVGLLALTQNWSQEIRLFSVVGVLGGFTTFSAFSLDTVRLFEQGQYFYAGCYVVASVLLSIAATFIGLFLIRTFA